MNFLTGDLILGMQQSITDNVKNFDKQIQGLPKFKMCFKLSFNLNLNLTR